MVIPAIVPMYARGPVMGSMPLPTLEMVKGTWFEALGGNTSAHWPRAAQPVGDGVGDDGDGVGDVGDGVGDVGDGVGDVGDGVGDVGDGVGDVGEIDIPAYAGLTSASRMLLFLPAIIVADGRVGTTDPVIRIAPISGADVWAWAGSSTLSTTGFVHFSGTSADEATTPPAFSNFLRLEAVVSVFFVSCCFFVVWFFLSSESLIWDTFGYFSGTGIPD